MAAIFGREGANVVYADIDEQSAVAAARETEDAGGVASARRVYFVVPVWRYFFLRNFCLGTVILRQVI